MNKIVSSRYGEKLSYDPQWAGPTEDKRRLTDFTFLILAFGIFLLLWAGVGYYACTNANLQGGASASDASSSNESRKSSEDVKDTLITLSIVFRCIILSAISSVIYIVLLRWFAKYTVYSAFLTICTFLLCSISVTIFYYYENSRRTDLLTLLFISSVALPTQIIVFIIYQKQIGMACEVFRESSKAITCFPALLIYPLFSFLMHGIVLIFAVFVWLHLTAIPRQKDKIHAHIYAFHAINIFGFLWLRAFLKGFGHMIFSGCYATWYWTNDKKFVPTDTVRRSLKITLRYHLGTLVSGSLILTISQMFHTMLKILGKFLLLCSLLFNSIAEIISERYEILFHRLQKKLIHLNKNAFTLCAVHGKDFLQSARDAHFLLMRNISQVFLVNQVANSIFILGYFFTICFAILGGAAYCYNEGLSDRIFSATLISIVGCMLMIDSFYVVPKLAISTIFHCVLEDYERNDGSADKPYFMSFKLRNLMIREHFES